jgi:nucleotidyltransferase substrate binding protein (TIGR01987 family)
MSSNQKKEQTAYKIGIFQKTVLSLERVVNLPVGKERIEIDSCIQRFEFTFEALWKTLKVVLLEKEGIEANSPKSVLNAAYKQRLINNEEIWLAMLEDRNHTSHTYDEETADHIYENVKNIYLLALKQTMLMLKERYGSEVTNK